MKSDDRFCGLRVLVPKEEIDQLKAIFSQTYVPEEKQTEIICFGKKG